MASPSPPSSPPHDPFDPDVNDSAVFRDLPRPERDPNTGITMLDLMEAEQRFGAHVVEGEEAAVLDVPAEDVLGGEKLLSREEAGPSAPRGLAGPITLAIRSAGDAMAVDDEETVPQRRRGQQHALQEQTEDTGDEPTCSIAKAMKRARTVQTKLQIKASLREIAIAPPPFAFPTAKLPIKWPSLDKYTAYNGLTPIYPAYWSFTPAHHLQKKHVADTLNTVLVAGQNFCAHRCGMGVQSQAVHLIKLSHLAEATFIANNLTFSLAGNEASKLLVWIADKMSFVLDHMLAVVEAEGAYQGATAITFPEYNIHEARRVQDRFTALLERVVHWDRYISKEVTFVGTLADSLAMTELKRFRTLLNQRTHENGTPGVRGFQPGHTKYHITRTNDLPGVDFDKDILALLPNVGVPIPVNAPKGEDGKIIEKARGILPRTDVIASNEHNERLATFTRGLVQQYVALRGLLSTCSPNRTITHRMRLPTIVQLEPTHSNERSIIIFKAAWLVFVQADKLWDVLRKHEEKGRVSEIWVQGDKIELKQRLKEMTKDALFTQIDAAREALRYEEVAGLVKYWRYEGDGDDVEMAE